MKECYPSYAADLVEPNQDPSAVAGADGGQQPSVPYPCLEAFPYAVELGEALASLAWAAVASPLSEDDVSALASGAVVESVETRPLVEGRKRVRSLGLKKLVAQEQEVVGSAHQGKQLDWQGIGSCH